MNGIESYLVDHPSFLNTLKKIIKKIYDVEDEVLEDAMKLLNYKLFRFLNSSLIFYVEYPYVDKLYRNSYYHYYASKNYPYSKNTIRISIFKSKLNGKLFSDTVKLQENYLGFFVIRPTFPNILGRNILNPMVFQDYNFELIKSNFQVTANFCKLKVDGFPHSSQDSETITCAETTIWSLIEYFSNKYAEYSPILPNELHHSLSGWSSERQVPSRGLNTSMIAFALKNKGFGVRIYNRESFKEDFESIINTYIDSGIPIVAAVTGNGIGHAFNIIGKRKTTYPAENDSNLILDIAKIPNEFVFVDDNFAPYRIGTLNNPCLHYNHIDWDNCQIDSIIVPLHSKIYMEAAEARMKTMYILENFKIANFDKPLAFKTFLCSSKTYKEYIFKLININDKIKTLILTSNMPKFIWISEIYEVDDYDSVKNVIIFDATEPNFTNIIGAFLGGYFLRKNISENVLKKVNFQPISPFSENLHYYGKVNTI